MVRRVPYCASVWYDQFSLRIYQEDSVAVPSEANSGVSVRFTYGHYSETLDKQQTIPVAGVDLLPVVVLEEFNSRKCLEITM